MTYFLDLRADGVGGNPSGSVTIWQAHAGIEGLIHVEVPALEELLRGRHVLLATHGFNVNRQDGIDSLGEWETALSIDNAVYIGILWPGDSRWMPVIDYPFEGDEAIRSARILAPFLNEHFVAAASLSFVSHSLGARMVLETVSGLDRRVRLLTLMAGAIDNTCLNEEYGTVPDKVDSIHALASTGDTVLEFAFPLGNILGGIISRGHPYYHEALGREGPDHPYVANMGQEWQIPDSWAFRHGDYLPHGPAAPPFPGLPVSIPAKDSDIPCTVARSNWTAGVIATWYRNGRQQS